MAIATRLGWVLSGPTTVADNHQLCRHRLQATLRKLKKMPAVREYDATGRQQLEMGIVEVESDVESMENSVIHHLPH